MLCAGCSSHMHYAEAQLYAQAVTEELIRLEVCKDVASCQAKQMVLWEGGGWKIGPFQGGGVTLQIYRITDTRVADVLVERCRRIHSTLPNTPVSIVIQSNEHIDTPHPGTQVVIRQVRIES